MSVVKKDKVVHGMLQEELERCERLISSLVAAIAELPKGSLHQRKIRHKNKVYSYHFCKFRDGAKSVYKQVPKNQVESLSEQIEARRKKEKNLKALNERVKYLRKLLKSGGN